MPSRRALIFWITNSSLYNTINKINILLLFSIINIFPIVLGLKYIVSIFKGIVSYFERGWLFRALSVRYYEYISSISITRRHWSFRQNQRLRLTMSAFYWRDINKWIPGLILSLPADADRRTLIEVRMWWINLSMHHHFILSYRLKRQVEARQFQCLEQ